MRTAAQETAPSVALRNCTKEARRKVSESESGVTQTCLTLCDPVGCRLWNSSIHGIFWATVQEWVTISFSSKCVIFGEKVLLLSHSVVSDSLWLHGLYLTGLPYPWGFYRQEYWSGLPCPPPGDLPNLGIEPRSPTLQVDSLLSVTPGKPLVKREYKQSSTFFSIRVPLLSWSCLLFLWSLLPFLDMRRYKNLAHKIGSWKYLSEDLSCQFFLNIEYFISALHLELLTGGVESQ